MKYFILAFKQAFNFQGRANRPEFWYFTLFSTIISAACSLIDSQLLDTPMTESGIVGGIYSLIVFIPSLSVTIRRFHDVNKSGWNLLWIFTIVGIFYLIYLEIIKGTDGPNNYGEVSEN
jgi:uncharacterized membrane protein YhaH (DUF805 family)